MATHTATVFHMLIFQALSTPNLVTHPTCNNIRFLDQDPVLVSVILHNIHVYPAVEEWFTVAVIDMMACVPDEEVLLPTVKKCHNVDAVPALTV